MTISARSIARSKRTKQASPEKPQAVTERLISAAIIRDGVVESRGFKAHWEIRAALGDDDPRRSNPYDTEGFLTSEGRFVSRDEAREIRLASGQLSRMWRDGGRKLLSSDIDWNAR